MYLIVPRSTQNYQELSKSTKKYIEVPQSTYKYLKVNISTTIVPQSTQSTSKYL